MTTRDYGQRSTGRSINRASMPNSIPPLQVRNYVELAGGLKELGLDSEDLFEYCIGEFLGEDDGVVFLTTQYEGTIGRYSGDDYPLILDETRRERREIKNRRRLRREIMQGINRSRVSQVKGSSPVEDRAYWESLRRMEASVQQKIDSILAEGRNPFRGECLKANGD